MNKKIILGITVVLILVSTGGSFIGCNIPSKNEVQTTASTDDEKIDIIFDAKKLENSTKENVDKLLNKTGIIPDSYKNTLWDKYYYEYDNQDSLYLDKSLKCISLSLSSGLTDKKTDIFDVEKCLKGYGLDIVDASYIDNPNNRKYSNIKDFEGEVSVFFNSDSIINKIIFYPKGEQAENDFKNEILKKIEDNTKKTENKDTANSESETVTTSKENTMNKDNNSKTNIKSLSDSERQTYLANLVKNNDKNYIAQQENMTKDKYEFSVEGFYTSNDQDIIGLNSFWGIEKEEYYDVCGYLTNVPRDDQVEGDLIRYLVGANSGKIIIIPFQGNMEAYQVKNNEIVKRYQYANGDSYKWR